MITNDMADKEMIEEKIGEALGLEKAAQKGGSTILNKTAEVGKKIIGGAADVLGYISGEMKTP